MRDKSGEAWLEATPMLDLGGGHFFAFDTREDVASLRRDYALTDGICLDPSNDDAVDDLAVLVFLCKHCTEGRNE